MVTEESVHVALAKFHGSRLGIVRFHRFHATVSGWTSLYWIPWYPRAVHRLASGFTPEFCCWAMRPRLGPHARPGLVAVAPGPTGL